MYHKGNYMISLNAQNYNTFSKHFKNNSINNLINDYYFQCSSINFSSFSCPHCNHKCTMICHGYYYRMIITNGIKYKIRILRVKCKECGRTHAVLPAFIIPYIQTSLNDAFIIINNYESKNSSVISDDYRIIKSYKRWIKRLLSIFLSFKNDITTLILSSIDKFKMFILQIHRGNYFYFS